MIYDVKLLWNEMFLLVKIKKLYGVWKSFEVKVFRRATYRYSNMKSKCIKKTSLVS